MNKKDNKYIIESYYSVQYYCPIRSKQKIRNLKTLEAVRSFVSGKNSFIRVKHHYTSSFYIGNEIMFRPHEDLVYKGTIRKWNTRI